MNEQKPYNQDALFYFPLIAVGVNDFANSLTIAVGDAKVFTDQQIFTNITAESVAFTSLSELPISGDTIDGATSGASGTFMFAIITSGTVGGLNAQGILFLKDVSGVFQNENLNIDDGTANVMTIGADTTAGLFAEVGNGTFCVAITAAEMQCKRGIIHIIDSTTKEWEDQAIYFETFGNVAAEKIIDFDEVMRGTNSVNVPAALVAIHLDRLFASDYNPASKPGVGTALFNELVENNGGVSRYTSAALAQAPSGISGDATEAKQNTILTNLAVVKTGMVATLVDTAILKIGVASFVSGVGLSETGQNQLVAAIQAAGLSDTDIQAICDCAVAAVGGIEVIKERTILGPCVRKVSTPALPSNI